MCQDDPAANSTGGPAAADPGERINKCTHYKTFKSDAFAIVKWQKTKSGTETILWLLSLLLVTDATTFTASLYATTAAAAAGSTRAFFRSTALPVTRLNTVISQNGPTSGTTAAPNGKKEEPAAAGAPEFVSLFSHFHLIYFFSSISSTCLTWPSVFTVCFKLRWPRGIKGYTCHGFGGDCWLCELF